MTIFDYVVLTIVGASLLFGLWRGVIGEVLALVAWGLGIVVAVQYGAALGQSQFTGIPEPAFRTLAGCAVAFFGVLIAMSLIGLAVKNMVKALGLRLSDRLLGMCFGLVRGLVIVLVLVGVGGMTSAPQQPWWRSAMLAQPLETAVMVTKQWLPDDLAKRIRFS